MGIKGRLMPTLHSLALSSGVSAWLAHRAPVRRILMVHNIAPGVLDPLIFEAQLCWLAGRFEVIDLAEMVARIEGGEPPRAPGELALTFDDGLRNHAEHAYRILHRHRLPATFFVCPQLIDERRWLWNQEARHRLQVLGDGARAEFARDVGAPCFDVEPVVGWMKTLDLGRRERVEQALRAATPGFAPGPELRAIFDPLSWEQMREMDPNLITIGSHTLDHPILPTLDDRELQRQLVQSRTLLEQRLQRPVEFFCYPNGANDLRARALVARHYRAAVTTEAGIVHADACRTALPRIPVAPTLALSAWRLNRPGA